MSVWVLSGNSGFFPQYKNMRTEVRLIGHCKLPVGVNVSVDGCFCLDVSPAMNLQLVQSEVVKYGWSECSRSNKASVSYGNLFKFEANKN